MLQLQLQFKKYSSQTTRHWLKNLKGENIARIFYIPEEANCIAKVRNPHALKSVRGLTLRDIRSYSITLFSLQRSGNTDWKVIKVNGVRSIHSRPLHSSNFTPGHFTTTISLPVNSLLPIRSYHLTPGHFTPTISLPVT